MKKRIYEFAEEMGVVAYDLMKYINDNQIAQVNTTLSYIDDDAIERIKKEIVPQNTKSREEQFIGKKLSWNEVKALFPHRYVVLDDYDEASSTGILLYVTEDRSDLWNFIFSKDNNDLKKLRHFYTTELWYTF